MLSIASWANLDMENHIFFKLVDEVNQIIAPLIKHFSLDSFSYLKTYNDGSQIRLTNQPEWIKYYLTQRLYLNSIFELPAANYSKSSVIYSHTNTHTEIFSAAKKFGLNPGITFIQPTNDGCEFYFLGTTITDRLILDQCLSHIHLLEKFIASFHDLAQKLLIQLEPHHVIAEDLSQNHLKYKTIPNINDIDFLASISGYEFTSRELDCIPLLLMGQSAKQIAETLGLSYRTVEIHIRNLKIKTKQVTKNDLIHVLANKFS